MVAYLIMLTRAAWHKWPVMGSDRLPPCLFAAPVAVAGSLLIPSVSERYLFVTDEKVII